MTSMIMIFSKKIKRAWAFYCLLVADSNVLIRTTIREMLLFTLREKIPFWGISSSFVRAMWMQETSGVPHGGQGGT